MVEKIISDYEKYLARFPNHYRPFECLLDLGLLSVVGLVYIISKRFIHKAYNSATMRTKSSWSCFRIFESLTLVSKAWFFDNKISAKAADWLFCKTVTLSFFCPFWSCYIKRNSFCQIEKNKFHQTSAFRIYLSSFHICRPTTPGALILNHL